MANVTTSTIQHTNLMLASTIIPQIRAASPISDRGSFSFSESKESRDEAHLPIYRCEASSTKAGFPKPVPADPHDDHPLTEHVPTGADPDGSVRGRMRQKVGAEK